MTRGRVCAVAALLSVLAACHDGKLRGRWRERCAHGGCETDAVAAGKPGSAGEDRAWMPWFTSGPAPNAQAGVGGPSSRLPAAGAGAAGATEGGSGAGTGGAAAGSTGSAAGDPGSQVTPERPSLRFVAPRVLYADEPRTLRLFGSALDKITAEAIYLGDDRLGYPIVHSASEARVPLPGLRAGEYFLRLGEPNDGQGRVRIMVLDRPAYPDSDVIIPGLPTQYIHDLERQAFFAVFVDPRGNAPGKVARIRFIGSEWKVEGVDLPAAYAVALAPDGRELWVTGNNCTLIHVNPESLAVGKVETLPGYCAGGYASVLLVLADGKVVFGSGQWLTAALYPSGTMFDTPNLYAPVALISQHATRMVWAAQGSTSSGSPSIYSYDVGSAMFQPQQLLSGDYFTDAILALSGDGERLMHYSSVYDREFKYLGRVAESTDQPNTIALSADGRVAAAYEAGGQTLTAYDVSGASSPFPGRKQLTLPAELATYVFRIALDDAGAYAFIFAVRNLDPSGNQAEHRFVVRRIAP